MTSQVSPKNLLAVLPPPPDFKMGLGNSLCKLVIERSQVQIPARAAGEFSSPGSHFSADSYFSIHFTPVLPQ